MKHYIMAQTEAVDQLARIVTVGMGTLGGMVVRQLLRTVSNPECVLLQSRDDVVHDLPALGKLVCGADCVFIVVDP